jgi:hypothetical protein
MRSLQYLESRKREGTKRTMDRSVALPVAHTGWIEELAHLLHQRLIWLLLGSYAVAAFAPAFGLWMRDVSVGGCICSRKARL